MAFKNLSGATPASDSPEALFNDLRGRKIKGLIAHQADVLRNYCHSAIDKPDVALKLPTGSGKTLVGLLLGEWRRQKFNERVVYLCPTNQLVNQVVEQANTKYGMTVRGFTGKIPSYLPAAKSEYQNAECVAVTSYSALFNTNPFFSDPHLIILDDAHSAENYIASNWSLRIERYNPEHQVLFQVFVALLRNFLSPSDYQKLSGEWNSSWDSSWVDKIPTPQIHSTLPDIISLLDTHVVDTQLQYSWSLLRDHLLACQLYIGTNEILIRPLIPPTNTHSPFADAKQRVYMSATLGTGGDLERLTGRANITRLDVPPGWDQQGIGRRLFFFPNWSFNEAEREELVFEMCQRASRALIIVPDDETAEKTRKEIGTRLGFATFSAKEIEQSKNTFVATEHAVAVIANRYEGIDFPDDDCRLLVLQGFPGAMNAQERFIATRMGASILLNDRVLTRIVQAFGRCTRSPTDYAAVVIYGDELHRYILRQECRAQLHPELQAELKIGLDQSKETTKKDVLENLDLFLRQTKEWGQVHGEILKLRNSLKQSIPAGTEDLHIAVNAELDYQYALWHGDYVAALEACNRVIAALKHNDLRGYRALWNYLAGSAAFLASKSGTPALAGRAQNHFKAAKDAARGIPWLANLSRFDGSSIDAEVPDRKVMVLVERLETNLEKIGTLHSQKFDEIEKFIRENLLASDNTQFKRGQTELGKLLGYDAGNKETTGAPDPWWIADENLCFIFEDHSDAKLASSLNVTKARQVCTHPNWVRKNLPMVEGAIILPVLVTPVTKADTDALPHLSEVALWKINDFRKWADNALTVIRQLRATFPGPGDLVWRAEAATAYMEHVLDPTGLLNFFKSQPASKMLSA
ncbi:MAG TPA: DEAD/DEAH box helicase [Verrucomicrobiae bacterium]|nr:DEAD/DEAH box helicase [Verrucomicrobiae bacterium]